MSAEEAVVVPKFVLIFGEKEERRRWKRRRGECGRGEKKLEKWKSRSEEGGEEEEEEGIRWRMGR
jgi:hypothetical protein